MPACGQAVGCGVCDTPEPELWCGAAGLCARVRACAGAAESLHAYIQMRQARRAASITAAMQRLFSPLYTLHFYTSTVRVNPSTRNPDLPSDVAEGFFEVGRHQDGGDGAAQTPGILLLPRYLRRSRSAQRPPCPC